MNEQKEKLSKPKQFALFCIFTFIIELCVLTMDRIFEFLPFSSIDTSVSDVFIGNFKTALMAMGDKPLMFAVIAAFSVAFSAVFACVRKKTNVSVAVLILSVLISAPITVSLGYIELAEFTTLVFLAIFALGILPFVFAMILEKKKKNLKAVFYASSVALSVAVVALAFFGSSVLIKNSIGEPDKMTSWAAINQQVTKRDGWKQIVKDSKFKLGEITETQEDGKVCDMGNYPKMDGSTVCVPMAAEFARQHLKMTDEDCRQFIDFSTTHYAYENLIKQFDRHSYMGVCLTDFEAMIKVNDGCDLLLGTEPSDEELALAKQYGVTLIKKSICYDAFVFITNKDNPVESLTVEQIKDIYSGKIKNWKEVGGNDEKIRAFQREPNSGSQTAMENLVMGGRDMIDPIEISVIGGMGELVDRVAEYQNNTASLGYTYRYYIDTLYKNDDIKTIAVDGIAPTDENIKGNVYPFSTNYYGVIRKDSSENAKQFLDWILSDEGQECVKQAGYIAIK